MLIVAVDHVDEDERGIEDQHTEVNWGVSDRLPRHKTFELLECVKPYLLCGAGSKRLAPRAPVTAPRTCGRVSLRSGRPLWLTSRPAWGRRRRGVGRL